MLETLKNAFKTKEIRVKIFLTLALLLVYRIGCYIPVPGLSADAIGNIFEETSFLSILTSMSGGSLQSATLFSLGILPFINAFIIMQLLTLVIPKLEKLSKEGDAGRRKITQITRYVALVLAADTFTSSAGEARALSSICSRSNQAGTRLTSPWRASSSY